MNPIIKIYLAGALSFLCMLMVYMTSITPDNMSVPLEIPAVGAPVTGPWYLEHEIDDEELNCLALNIYHEARGEIPEGMYAVADVVLHRVMHSRFPDTVCEVVKDGVYAKWNTKDPVRHKCQFSFFCDGRSDYPYDRGAFRAALYVARDVLFNPEYVPEVAYALYYHADYADPAWKKYKIFVKQVGDHLFYTNKPNPTPYLD